MSAKLLGCPFCGREPTTAGRACSPFDGGGHVFYVACYCGRLIACAHKDGTGATPEEALQNAVAAWNTRAAHLAKHLAAPDGAEGGALPPHSDSNSGPLPRNCSRALREAGKAYPRTCQACGLGPCKGGE